MEYSGTKVLFPRGFELGRNAQRVSQFGLLVRVCFFKHFLLTHVWMVILISLRLFSTLKMKIILVPWMPMNLTVQQLMQVCAIQYEK